MYHLSVKPISRSAGRSATAAAAYRAGEEIVDERTGEVHDYTRKGGVEHAEIVLPAGSPGWAVDRAALWNAAEAAEKRKDARVAREYEVALPKELSRAQGIELMRDFAADLVERYGVAVDFAIHRDHREKWDGSEKGFDAFHAHVLTSTRQMGRDGFGEKASPELSDAKRRSLGLGEGAKEVERTRERWEIVANRHLEMAGESQRIDRRSLKEQGIDREPTRHLGPIVTALERRGIQTDTGDVNRRIEAAYLQGVRERAELAALRPRVLDLSSSIEQALLLRDGQRVREREEARLRAEAQRGKGGEPGSGVPGSVPSWVNRPPEQVEAAFEALRSEFARHRRDKVHRVHLKAEVRHARRDRAMRQVMAQRPKPPDGLLAGFKRKAYEQAAAVWDKAARRAQKLVQQAATLRQSLSEAGQLQKAMGWAHDRLQRRQPALTQRYEQIKEMKRQAGVQQRAQQERAQQEQSRELGRELSRELNRKRDRGMDGPSR